MKKTFKKLNRKLLLSTISMGIGAFMATTVKPEGFLETLSWAWVLLIFLFNQGWYPANWTVNKLEECYNVIKNDR